MPDGCNEAKARISHLERLPEKATRDGKRQAAPFSKGPPKEKPKKPERKSGTTYGPKAHRPLPKQEPDEIIDLLLPEPCGECGGGTMEVTRQAMRLMLVDLDGTPAVNALMPWRGA